MKKKKNFEDAMARLEEITTLLGEETLPLEQSLALFQEGAELVTYCNGLLGEAKLKIETLFPQQADAETEETQE